MPAKLLHYLSKLGTHYKLVVEKIIPNHYSSEVLWHFDYGSRPRDIDHSIAPLEEAQNHAHNVWQLFLKFNDLH